MGFSQTTDPQLGEKRLSSGGSSFLACMMRLIVPSVVSLSSSAPASDNATLSAADVGPPLAGMRLITALAWAVLDHHFEIADFFLGARGQYQHALELP